MRRRTFLTAAAAAPFAATTAGAQSGVETIEVPDGEHHVENVESGDTLSGVVYDISTANSGVTIAAHGTDWEIKDIAVVGKQDVGDTAAIAVSDTGGGNSLIENVWMGDGAVYEHKGCTGVWVAPEHNGRLIIDAVNIQNMGDNAFYTSAPGSGGAGEVSIRNCYAKNNWVAHYRLAHGEVLNCVAVNDDDREYRQGRGVWAWNPGPVEVYDSDLAVDDHSYAFDTGGGDAQTQIVVEGTAYDTGFNDGVSNPEMCEIDGGGDPVDHLPTGCPASPDDI